MSTLAAQFPTTSATIAPGTIIGRRFRIDEVIAAGGMGIVYKGWHLVLDHPIAIKVVRPEYADRTEIISLFVNECRNNAQLRGAHAARVLDMGRIENGPPYMILEYLEGVDLRELLASDGPLPLSCAADYLVQSCEAVAEAHQQGIVHRDLKPDNLFIARMPRGEVLKVIDFGISKRLDATTSPITMQNDGLGSPQYMAPEQISNPDNVNPRADVWSLGVVLFELLTNSTPFRGESIEAACSRVLYDDPISLCSLRPDLPVEIEAVVLRCLHKQPELRYQSVNELALALEPFTSQAQSSRPGRCFVIGDTESTVDWTTLQLHSLAQGGGAQCDITLPSPRPTNLKYVTRSEWPAALATATAALALFCGSVTLRKLTTSAVKHFEYAMQSSAHTVSAMAANAATFIETGIAPYSGSDSRQSAPAASPRH